MPPGGPPARARCQQPAHADPARGARCASRCASGGARVLVVAAGFRGYDHGALADRGARRTAPRSSTSSSPGAAASPTCCAHAPRAAHAEPGRASGRPGLPALHLGHRVRPKGAVHSHDTLGHEDRSMVDHLRARPPTTSCWRASPVAHVTGVLYGFHLASMLGTAVVLCDVWSPERGWELVTAEGAASTVAATPFLHGLTHSPARPPIVVRCGCFGCGGADVPPELVREAERALAARWCGSTARPRSPRSTAGHADDPAELRAGTDGRVIGLGELRVVDDAEQRGARRHGRAPAGPGAGDVPGLPRPGPPGARRRGLVRHR